MMTPTGETTFCFNTKPCSNKKQTLRDIVIRSLCGAISAEQAAPIEEYCCRTACTANVYISATSLLQLQRCSLHLVVVYDYQMYFTTSTLHPSVVINTFTSLLQPKRCSLKVSTSMLRLKRCTLTMQTLILQMVEYFSQCSAQLARCT